MANEPGGLGIADAEAFRKLASRCRRLMLFVRTTAVREKLRILAEEFEEKAEQIEQQQHSE
jgi:hypothetical protein